MSSSTLGRYQLIRLLAQGGMAEIYLAWGQPGPLADGESIHVALKKLLPLYEELPEFTRLFIDEARISLSLQHPHIVRVLDYGRDGSEHFMVMELIDGPDLAKILSIAQGRGLQLPVEALLTVARSVTAGLAYAHEHRDSQGRPLNIVHRDLSPPNILVGSDGTVKITDFGVARAHRRWSTSRPGTVRGRFAYMAPEQLRGEDVDARSDLFGLGVVLYEMATGTNPFQGRSEAESRQAILSGPPTSPGALRPDLPVDLTALIMGLLEPDPAGRPASTALLQADLARIGSRLLPSEGKAALRRLLGELFPEQMRRRGMSAAAPTPVVRPKPAPVPTEEPSTLDLPPGALVTGSWRSGGVLPAVEGDRRLVQDDRRARLILPAGAAPPEVSPSPAAPPPAPAVSSRPTAPRGRQESPWSLPLVSVILALVVTLAIALPRGCQQESGYRPMVDQSSDTSGDRLSATASSTDQEPDKLGVLRVDSTPWAYVELDGQLLQWVTPLEIPVAAGTHDVVLSNPELGWRVKRRVEVVAGRTMQLEVRR